jgi:plastocyanin
MRRQTSAGPATLAVLLLILVLAVATVAPSAASATTKRVTIQNYSFAPQVIHIAKGTTVVWKNADSVTHRIASASTMSTAATTTGLFASPDLSHGKSFSFTFKKKGTYYFECTIHASMATMHGKVVVK